VRLAFIESRPFTERLRLLSSDEAYRAFQNELQDNPEKGDLIQGACGVRKVRMRVPGQGKRGGARVIYLYLQNHAVIYFLTLYTKSAQADLSPDQKKAICALVEQIKSTRRDSV
jgi:hypothetical protein